MNTKPLKVKSKQPKLWNELPIIRQDARVTLTLEKVSFSEAKEMLNAARSMRIETLFTAKNEVDHVWVQLRDITPSMIYTFGYLTNHFLASKQLRKTEKPKSSIILPYGSNNQR